MAISQATEEQYENNRLRMMQVNRGFRRYMWSCIILGAMIFSTAFFAGAASTLHDQQENAMIFYYAMSAGVFQILLGLATIILGWLTAAKNRIPSLISLGIDLVGLIAILMGISKTFPAINIIFLAIGIALNIWIQTVCKDTGAIYCDALSTVQDVSGVLLQFLCAVGMGYMTGCIYPSYFFPEGVQRVGAFLPSGAARVFLAKGAEGSFSVPDFLILIGYFALFFLGSVLLRKRRIAAEGGGL